MKKRKFALLLTVAAILFGIGNTAAAAENDGVPIVIDGREIYSDVEPYISNGRTMVPIRLISEELGADVTYDPEERSVTINSADVGIYLQIDNTSVKVNDITQTIDISPEIKNGRTMVPLRFIAESFGCEVVYDAETGLVTVTTEIKPENVIHEKPNGPYVEINDNIPYFTEDEITDKPFEKYSELDSLGRAGVAFACVGTETMPTEERGSIGQVRPAGWHTVKYDFIDGKYLYNRCHLIGYQLTAENANEKNLITGTRYFNTVGMLPFENKVANYVKSTENHVLYRVTPVYEGNDLVANGVNIEAVSVEDNGKGIKFNVFVYNIQPGIEIFYETGESVEADDAYLYYLGKTVEESSTRATDTTFESTESTTDKVTEETTEETTQRKSERTTEETTQIKTESTTEEATLETTVKMTEETTENTDQNTSQNQASIYSYILNTSTMKFHYPGCTSVKNMSSKNKQSFTGSRDDIIKMGYSPCERCNS